jgi:SOS-response transcriptional repressor LexA
MTDKKIDEILRENLVRFMEEENISREEVVRRYNAVAGKKIGPSWISQMRSGKPIGKNAIKVLARVFHKEVWEFYVPRGKGYRVRDLPPMGKMIPVIPLSANPSAILRGDTVMIGDESRFEVMALSTSKDPRSFFVRCDKPGCGNRGKCNFGDYLLIEPGKKPRPGGYVLVRYRDNLSIREYQIVRRGKATETLLHPICAMDPEPAILANDNPGSGDLVYFPVTQIIRNLEEAPPRGLVTS